MLLLCDVFMALLCVYVLVAGCFVCFALATVLFALRLVGVVVACSLFVVFECLFIILCRWLIVLF